MCENCLAIRVLLCGKSRPALFVQNLRNPQGVPNIVIKEEVYGPDYLPPKMKLMRVPERLATDSTAFDCNLLFGILALQLDFVSRQGGRPRWRFSAD